MYIGIDLGGRKGKSTYVSMLEVRNMLPRVVDVKQVPPMGDEFILQYILNSHDLGAVGFDSPFQLPVCLRCSEKCPGMELCRNPIKEEILRKGGNPYAQRMTELYISDRFVEIRPMQTMALGQIVSRMIYLLKRLEVLSVPREKILEIYPKASLLALGKALRIGEIVELIKGYKKDGAAYRKRLIEALSPLIDFGHYDDVCAESHDAFDSTISGYTAFLADIGLAVSRPERVYEQDGWIEIPDYSRIRKRLI